MKIIMKNTTTGTSINIFDDAGRIGKGIITNDPMKANAFVKRVLDKYYPPPRRTQAVSRFFAECRRAWPDQGFLKNWTYWFKSYRSAKGVLYYRLFLTESQYIQMTESKFNHHFKEL